jgi:hypothetical protein
MRIRLIATLAAASAFVFACRDTPPAAPTDPGVDISFAKGTGGACDATVSRTAKAQLMDLLNNPTLKVAQGYWDAVVNACSTSNPDAANGQLMIYVNYLRGLYPAGFITSSAGSKSTLFRAHLNTVFSYVGYSAPNITNRQLDSAIVQVILPTGGTREYILPHLGAFKLPEQDSNGDPRGHLFVMDSAFASCLTVDNLEKFGTCIDVVSFPTVSPKFSPGIQVGICVPETITNNGLALGHQVNSTTTEVAGQLAYPGDCHPAEVVEGSWTGGPKALLKRLAWVGKKALLPAKAYGTDKGIGGIGGALSPWGALNAQIFAAEFGVPPNTVGQPPVLTYGNFYFTQAVDAPGSILVQASLGTYTGPLVVLSQGGGNCTVCGGLNLTAHFYSVSGTPADDGVYEVNWTSVQASPSVKGAPFVVRDLAGHEIARVTYLTAKNSQNKLAYNGTNLSGVTWVRNVAQNFSIIVDLNTNTTSLKIDGVTVASGKAFVSGLANDLATLGAEFSGIDSGVMGWDQIGVRRIPDQPQP